MEPTVSDPTVVQQKGMRVGLPDAGQINALETLNMRGERSVTCKGAFDAHPSTGPLPAGAPAACEEFRKQPDALERAAELDAQFGSKPDLAAMPMYCVVTAFKDPFDTKDMRSTANNDVNFAMDVPPFDSTIAARFRAKGAIIYAKSIAHEFNAGPGNPGRRQHEPRTNLVSGGQQLSSWSGQACNPYDTERVVRGSTGGSGAAISANLAMIGICEQSAASCQGPASRNGIALLLHDERAHAGQRRHRQPVVPRSRRASTRARSRDATLRARRAERPETAATTTRATRSRHCRKRWCRSSRMRASSSTTRASRGSEKPLAGMRIAILREHMVKETANHVAISDRDRSRDQDGAARPARRGARRDAHGRSTPTTRRCRT